MGRSPNFRNLIIPFIKKTPLCVLKEIYEMSETDLVNFKFVFRYQQYEHCQTKEECEFIPLTRECSTYGFYEDFLPKKMEYFFSHRDSFTLNGGEDFCAMIFTPSKERYWPTWGLSLEGYLYNIESIEIRAVLTGLDIIKEDGTVASHSFEIQDPYPSNYGYQVINEDGDTF